MQQGTHRHVMRRLLLVPGEHCTVMLVCSPVSMVSGWVVLTARSCQCLHSVTALSLIVNHNNSSLCWSPLSITEQCCMQWCKALPVLINNWLQWNWAVIESFMSVGTRTWDYWWDLHRLQPTQFWYFQIRILELDCEGNTQHCDNEQVDRDLTRM